MLEHQMLRLIVRRLVVGLLVAFTVMVLAFMLTRLSGDLATSIAGPSATQADVEIVRKAYGLDRPRHDRRFRPELLLQRQRGEPDRAAHADHPDARAGGLEPCADHLNTARHSGGG